MLIEQMPCVAIHKLVEAVDSEYVRQRVARGPEELESWQSNIAVLYGRGKDIRVLDEKHRQLAEDALAEWANRRVRFLTLFGDSGTAFAFWFQSIREDLRSHKISVDAALDDSLTNRSAELARRVVSNIGWCTTFAYFLPRAVPELKWRALDAGLEMLAVFWLEQLARAKDSARRNPSPRPVSYESSRIDQLIDGCIASTRDHDTEADSA